MAVGSLLQNLAEKKMKRVGEGQKQQKCGGGGGGGDCGGGRKQQKCCGGDGGGGRGVKTIEMWWWWWWREKTEMCWCWWETIEMWCGGSGRKNKCDDSVIQFH